MVESSLQLVHSSDPEPWDLIVDDPAVFGENTGWSGLAVASAQAKLKVIPYGCINTSTKTLTLTE
jgi:hypothetical protein